MQSYEEIVELKAQLEKENVYLQEEIRTEHNFSKRSLGTVEALLAVLRKVEQVAPTDSTVLIYGETGTGKELIARAIHDRSTRKNRPLLKVNCSAISAGLVESELFGHVKGAFTGAFERHIGRFEMADGGTIFLDEIGELPLGTQVKLLRVLQEREFEPAGSNRPVSVDVRVMAATNRNLLESRRTGDFRSDLYYRLNVFPIDVPALRDRRADIPHLAMFFLSRFFKKTRKEHTRDSARDARSAEKLCMAREYQRTAKRDRAGRDPGARFGSRTGTPILFPFLTPAGSSTTGDRSSGEGAPVASRPSNSVTLEEIERGHIMSVLTQTRGVVEGPRGAAKILGLHPNTLRHRIQKLGLKRSTYHES